MSMIGEQIRYLREFDCFGTVKQAMDEAADTIEALSVKLSAANMERSALYYNGGWIPCSERLPEIGNKTYLVTYETISGKRYVRDCFYGNIRGAWSKKIRGKVIAWRNLPEAYES